MVKIPKNSPSLMTLKGSKKKIKSYIIPKKKYVVGYEEIAAFKRRGKCGYEDYICKITAMMLKEFTDYIKKEYCEEKIVMNNKDEFCQEDVSQISLVSPTHDISIHDSDVSCNTSSGTSDENNVLEKLDQWSSEHEVKEVNESMKKDIYEDDISEEYLNEDFEKKRTSIEEVQDEVMGDEMEQGGELSDFKQEYKENFPKEKINLEETKPVLVKQSDWFSEDELLDINVDVLFKNGNRYQGRLSCYMMEGDATYKWGDGTTYQGHFIDGVSEGLGLIRWPDGSWYDGEIKCNRRHGRGISIQKQKGVPKMCYFGNWKNGRTNGKGMLIFGENNWYDGYWKKGRHDGIGLRQYPSGSRYLGEWKDGKENGWGTMVWSNHDVYTGNWLNGKMDGKGTYAWNCIKSDSFVQPMQNTYIGQWKNGTRHGHGSLLLANGVVIHAFWVNGVKEGPGQIICRNGIVIESSDLFMDDKIYKLGSPIMVPFWNTWYSEFLSSYRSGLFYIQPIEDHTSEAEKMKKLGIVTPDRYNECSNNIPIFAPIESLPLWEIVLKAVCQPIPDLTGKLSYYIRGEDVELLTLEEMWLRKVITNRMADITCLYQHYATIACARTPPFKACMFRLMLWQMCRDCNLEESSLNLCQVDHETGCDSFPFAIILVFQMIHYLLVLTYHICVKKRKANPEIPGRYGGAFDYFLTNHALPGMQKTNRIRELCNTISLKKVFCLYETIGMPVTLGKIFDYFFSDVTSLEETEEKPKININAKMNGKNKIYPDGSIVYEEFDGTLLGTVFDFEEPQSSRFDLNEIKLLGQRELAKNLFNVCPKAKNDNIPNVDYEVSFLEFCEFIKITITKYDSFIDPDSEVTLVTKLTKCDLCKKWVQMDQHYEVEHETKAKYSGVFKEGKEITTMVSSESSRGCSTLSGESKKSSTTVDEETIEICDKGSNEIQTSTIGDTYDHQSAMRKDDICPCKHHDLIPRNENHCTELCKCNNFCECSCNVLKDSEDSESFEIIERHSSSSIENSIKSTSIQFKDAKTITLTACDSDCPCFCHEEAEYINEVSFEEEEQFEGSDNENMNLKRESSESEDTLSTLSLSDAIHFLCDKTNEEGVEEEYEESLEDYSEGESISEISGLDTSCSEVGEESENELCESWSSDDLVSGEDFMITTKKFLTDLERIEASNNTKSGQKIYEKLLEFSCPKFKIKHKEFFKNISTRGMTPQELREKLKLEESEKQYPFKEQEVEDIESQLIDESLKVIALVAKQRLYEKLLLRQFRNTISQVSSGEYWENFVENVACKCSCKHCLAGVCEKVKEKIKISIGDAECEVSSDSSVSII